MVEPRMTLLEARTIYRHPQGHPRTELLECLDRLNNAAQPVEVSAVQYAAIADALARLKLLGFSVETGGV